MARAGSNSRPTFAWQGTLIVLPVLLLAALGFFSLRQDRALAEHEAAERAQGIADELAARMWTELTARPAADTPGDCFFQVDSAGRLLFPPPVAPLPALQPLDPAQLARPQARLWQSAQHAEAQAASRASSLEAWHAFLATDPPADFGAAAHYAMALLLEKQSEPKPAAREFQVVLEKYPGAVGESGLPLAPLAQFKLLQLEAAPRATPEGQPAAWDTFCSNVVNHPTPLSSEFLARALELATNAQTQPRVQYWQRRWQQHELSRSLFAAASGRGLDSPVSWIDLPPAAPPTSTPTGDSPAFQFENPALWTATLTFGIKPDGSLDEAHWLCVRLEDSATNRWFFCRSQSDVGNRLAGLVDSARTIPEYFGVGLELGGRKLPRFERALQLWHTTRYMSKSGGQTKKEFLDRPATNLLASASAPSKGPGWLQVGVYLTSPEALFERQAARTFWLGALIAATALAALVGLLSAWKAFMRQQQLGELKSNFVSSVSHELRAPIASVRLLAESLERGKVAEAPRQQEYFRFIVQECRRLSALVENVLDFSRIEQGRKQYEFEPTDLVALTQQTVKVMEPYAADRHVRLELDLSAAPALTPTLDGKAIQQALVNLLDNAIKHSPRDGVVTVGFERRETAASDGTPPATGTPPAGPRIGLWVEDRGEGIPPEEHEKIFERFYRRGSELRRETQGVGIGLSIVKHIVEAHGGRVLVRSAAGQGSRFTVELPCKPWNAS